MSDTPHIAPQGEHPVNPLPMAVIILFLGIAGIEIALSLAGRGILGGPGGVGWRLAAVRDYGFSAEIFDWMLVNGRYPPDLLARFVTYPFVHPSFTSALFSGVMLLALGKWVGSAMGSIAVFVFFFVGAIAGALAYGFIGRDYPLIGAFPPVYGLIGGFTWLLWVRLRAVGAAQVRAFSLIGFLMGLQLLFGVLFGGTREWVADLAGFLGGFAVAPLLVKGGLAAVLARMRRA